MNFTANESPLGSNQRLGYSIRGMDMNKCYVGDCQQVLKVLVPDASIDLIVTSPPYAEKRKHTYGGIPATEYVSWFEGKASEFYRVLKPTGSLIINIKEGAKNYEIETYTYELVLKMRQWGWLWVNDYVWHKKNCYPGKYPNRLKDGWEHCYHFSKQKQIAFYPEQVMVEAAESTIKRANSLSEKEKPIRSLGEYNANGGLKKIPEDTISRKPMVLPSNVLHLPAEFRNRGHSAAFPEALPEFFIKLLTKPGDVVMDPFAGSGTSLAVAQRLGRNWIGCELLPEYLPVIMERVREVQGGAA